MDLLERAPLLLEAVAGGHTGLAVPYVQQSTNCSCGAACLLAVARYWRALPNVKDRELFGPLGTNCKIGTDSQKIVQVARRLGLSAEISNGTGLDVLRRALARGVAPVLNFQAWPTRKTRPLVDRKDGHYAVLVGLDGGRAYFMDPAISGGRLGWLPLAELDRAWLDLESAGRVSRRAILIRGTSNLGRGRIGNPVRIETGR